MSKFDTHFRPKVNYLEYRVLFQNRVQNYDEPIEQFIRVCMKFPKTAITVKTNTRISVTVFLLGAKINKCRNPFA